MYILALAIPGDKTDCCEGMPKVMQARLATCAAQTRYASFLAQALEGSFRLLARHAIGLPSSQERRRGRSPCWPLQHYVMPKSLEQVMAHRNESALVELALTNCEYTSGEIKVGQAEPDRLADAQPGSVEEEQQHPKGMRLQQPALALALGGVEKPAHILRGVNVWLELLGRTRSAGLQRNLHDIVPG